MADAGQTRMTMNRMIPPGGPPRVPQASADTLTPRDIAVILRRHIFLIVSLAILGLALGVGGYYAMAKYAPKYTAYALIRVLPPMVQDPMQISSGQVNKDIQYGNRVYMANLIRQPNMFQSLLGRDKIQQTDWFKNFADSKSERLSKASKVLKEDLGASPNRDAEFITVSMTCGSAEESAVIVNETVDLFVKSQQSGKRDEYSQKLNAYNDELARLQRELNQAEDSLSRIQTAFLAESGFAGLQEDQFQHTITQKLNNLEIQENDLKLQITQIESSVESLKRQATGPVTEQIENIIETDPIMTMLAQQLALEEANLSGRMTKFGENHRVVQEIRQKIEEIKERRRIRKTEISELTRQANLQNAQDTLVAMMSRLENLGKMRDESAKKKESLDLARVQYEKQTKIRDERRERLDETNALIEKTKLLLEDPQAPKVQKLGDAQKPLEMSSPRKLVYFPGGLMLGMMLGVGLAFLIELLNDLVRTPRDVIRHLNVPLLCVIPDVDEDHQLDDKADLYNIVRNEPYSVLSECYRRFRTNLKLSSPPDHVKTLLVTSPMAGDGKTSVAINLATTFVAESKKVLVIDANFWKPAIHSKLASININGEDNPAIAEAGLSTYLTGLSESGEIVRKTDIDGFDVIDAGPLPSNPAELLGSGRMDTLLSEMRGSYDYVIVDGPPVLLVSAVKMLARQVDGTLLVFNAAKTKRGVAIRTIRELREVNAVLSGCVLFAAKAMKGGYFNEQFKSYREYQKLQLARSV
ncbi:MAG: polysaccharide biosynthesis tyrosine autokinase [Phycisphaerae bacterium]|nr:polysaccharide biosynthesis tyrosine autokinase [Phycisphaerae bacterium]